MSTISIVLTGPESTGKTTLSQQLAAHFDTTWVPEYAREYLGNLDRPYAEKDLLEMAKGQVALEEKILNASNEELVFHDTSLEVIKIWSEIKYGRCHPWIINKMKSRRLKFYLLCCPDIQWSFDLLRENPNDRQEIFETYKRDFIKQNLNFVELSGTDEKRILNAINHVQSFLHTNSIHA